VILKGSRGVFKSKLFLCSDGFHCLLHNCIFTQKKLLFEENKKLYSKGEGANEVVGEINNFFVKKWAPEGRKKSDLTSQFGC